MKTNQNRAPIVEALKKNVSKRMVSFDVPGHKQGKGNPLLKDFVGSHAIQYDVNSRRDLDNLIHPTGIIFEAEKLAAKAFKAGHAFFIVNGTSAAVQCMVMCVVKRHEKIIMPRNVHRSAINALIVTGAIPVYVNPGIHSQLGIPLGMSIDDVKEAIEKNPDAKAIFINNPTYYGICSDLKAITDLAHQHHMKVIVDEAHGTHFYFKKGLPLNAMAAGADMAAVSMHKTGGSLTQSSFLLIKDPKLMGETRQILNLTHTTSGSYLLTGSLDVARQYLATHGEKLFSEVVKMTDYAREEINAIEGYWAFGKDIIDDKYIHDFDVTKLSIHTADLGLSGSEVYDILRDRYNIQIEFGDLGNILAIISVGDNWPNVERLISALEDIKDVYENPSVKIVGQEYIAPDVCLSPQEAFYATKKSVRLNKAVGLISGESIMCYPPGIPIIAPGERITQAALDYIEFAGNHGAFVTGPEDSSITNIKVVIQ